MKRIFFLAIILSFCMTLFSCGQSDGMSGNSNLGSIGTALDRTLQKVFPDDTPPEKRYIDSIMSMYILIETSKITNREIIEDFIAGLDKGIEANYQPKDADYKPNLLKTMRVLIYEEKLKDYQTALTYLEKDFPEESVSDLGPTFYKTTRYRLQAHIAREKGDHERERYYRELGYQYLTGYLKSHQKEIEKFLYGNDKDYGMDGRECRYVVEQYLRFHSAIDSTAVYEEIEKIKKLNKKNIEWMNGVMEIIAADNTDTSARQMSQSYN